MPTVVECAHLSEAAYEDIGSDVRVYIRRRAQRTVNTCNINDSAVVWKRGQTNSAWNGFYAVAFELSSINIIAFRGTETTLNAIAGDLVSDAYIFTGGMPPQAFTAIEMVSSASKKPLLFTGHSLGGALAIIASAHFGVPAVTFNAPGALGSCMASAGAGGLKNFFNVVGRCALGSKVKNIRIEADPVSSFWTTRFQSGGREKALAASSCGFDLLCRHSIKTCIEQVSNLSQHHEEVSF